MTKLKRSITTSTVTKISSAESWVRHGGIQRLSRERVRKINDLKKQLEELNKTYNEDMQFYEDRDAKLCKELNDTRAEKKAALDKLPAIRSVLI